MTITRRRAAQTLGAIRLVNGAAALFTPKLMIRLLRVDPDAHPQMIYFMKMFGIRTILLGVQLFSLEGEDLDRAMRTGILIHASDTAAAAVAGITGQLPKRAAMSGTAISTLNTVLAVYGSGLIGNPGAISELLGAV